MHKILRHFLRVRLPKELIISICFYGITISAVVLSGACTPSSPGDLPTQSPSSTPIPSSTPESSSTLAPPLVLLMNPPDDYLKLSDPVRQTLEVLSQQEGWRFLSTSSLTPEILTEDIRVFVFFDGADEILEMINSRLGTIFVGIGVEGLDPKENVIIIGPDGFRLDQQAFLAGFIAAVLTQDWRIGEIAQLPAEDLPAVELGFQNGITFYCGLCQLAYPPFHNYPVFYSIEGGSSDGNWSAAVESLQSFAVNTIFLFTNELDLAALERLEMAEILLLGTSAPPEEYLSNWIATVRLSPEIIILENWDDISSGQGGWTELIPISIEDVNQSVLSEGKLLFIREVLLDIQEGYISPAVTPPAPIEN